MWRRHTDVEVDGRRRNGNGGGAQGREWLRDVEAMEVQRVMGIPDILHHEPT